MRFDAELYGRALRFAAERHAGQRVPGTELPYLLHVTSVAGELAAALDDERVDDANLALCCALLHDTLEDTNTTADELRELFGAAICEGVQALTKDPALTKVDAMRDSLARIARQPREVALVKLADRVTNLAPPPPHWSPKKRRAYRDEAEHIAAALGSQSYALVNRLYARIALYEAHLR